MKNIKIILITFSLFILSFAKANKPHEADEYYKIGKYAEALAIYENINPRNVHIKKQMASCYFYLHQYKNAEKQYHILIDNEINDFETMYRYGIILMYNSKYNEAITIFNNCKQLSNSEEKIERKISSCHWALNNLTEKPFYELNKLNIQTGGKSMGIAPYNGGFIYSSPNHDKENTTNYYKLSLIYPLDTEHKNRFKHIFRDNKQSFYEGAPSLSSDGKTIYFTKNLSSKEKVNTNKKEKHSISNDSINHLGIFKAELINGQWSNIEELPFNSIKFSNCHPSISKDNNKLYFSSNKPNGEGGFDIYVSIRLKDSWSEPYNLGKSINTDENELFPFIYNQQLYFSSDGHIGFGGLDVFAFRIDSANYVRNMGYGINSSKDDFAIVYTDDEKGYISSDRENENGGDLIYSLDKAIYPIIINTNTINKISQKSIIDADINLTNRVTSESLSNHSDSLGMCSLKFFPNNSYTLIISYEGYKTKTIEIPSNITEKELKDIIGMIELEPIIKKNTVINLDNILFAVDKVEYLQESEEILRKLGEYMIENPELKIELSAHTDSRGSDNYNNILSEGRAYSCAKFLIMNGIEPDRINFKGYGEKKLLNNCTDNHECSEDEHQINRRVEIKFL